MVLQSTLKKGFTIIELVVTVSVFVLLSAVLLGNYRSTTRSLSLNTLANLVSTEIRQAQSREIGSTYLNEMKASGVSFDMTYPNSYMSFADSSALGNNRNDNLDPSCGGECKERMTIKSGSSISQLCGNIKKNRTCTPVNSLHIAFLRPNPEPTITGVDTSNNILPFSDAEIMITSSDGSITKTIVVWSTGLITVE